MVRLSAVLYLGLVSLWWSSGRSQENDTCTSESCGISSCEAGYELNVTIDSTDLVISCNPCDVDYYKTGDGAGSCLACGDGLVASGGATVCTLEEGFWRLTDTSTTVYECPNCDACAGGSDVSSYCAEGFSGPLCAVCDSDYYSSGSYECLECSATNTASTIITIIVFAGVIGIFLVVLMRGASMIEDKARESLEDDDANEETREMILTSLNARIYQFVKQWKDTLVVRLKIMVTHFQVVTTFPVVLDLQWPDAFTRYSDKFSIISLDFWGILTQTCFFRSDYLKQLVFTTILPIAIVLILLANYMRAMKKAGSDPTKRRAAWDTASGGVLLTAFFFYIITSTLVLKAFDCQEFEDGSRYLKADYSISCDSVTYDFIYGYSIAMAVVYPAGIPATYLIALVIRRQHINPNPLNPEVSMQAREADPTIQKTKFLWGTYRPAVYFYEVWECVRKLFLTGLLVYFEEGTSTQVVVAILLTLAGLRVLSGLRPYQREDENNLAEASIWVTFLTLFVGLLIKAGVTEEDGYDSVALGVVLTLINMSLLILAVFQILWTTSMYFKEKWSEFFGVEDKVERPTTNTRKFTRNSRAVRGEPNAEHERAPLASRGRVREGTPTPPHRSPVALDRPVSRPSKSRDPKIISNIRPASMA
ncbi:unnamed protein product [Ascophyllum nodosum]